MEPAVPGSAAYSPGSWICPGVKSTAQDPTSAPVNLDAEHISAASLIPLRVDVKEK